MKPLIHPTAIIHPRAELHPTVRVEPYAIIGEGVKIDANTVIGSHAVIEGVTEIGTDNQIFPGVVIGLEPQDFKYQGAKSCVEIGNGNKIREYVTINRATGEGKATKIGNNNLLMAYTHVAHNCVIEDEIIIANSVALAGHVHIESKALISGMLGVHQYVKIGSLSMIGGMSRIERDVPPYMLVEGNPAKVRSLNFVGLRRRGFTAMEVNSLKTAFRILYRCDYTLETAISKLASIEGEPIEHLKNFLATAVVESRRGLISPKRNVRNG